ncbi:condensation domain-containing protein [Tumebacillus flagellatus]|uniref:Carrier domain-containing protein n=1 Tax=Tumebacillus flagellatus TaxID=1157490 RepID=A0A074LSC1_9BACL|nr:condensation domain-containing protein [Tumebacillus flagellatus]KEO84019.1 hypothetical protein EL26_07495 [Tumebacillus flagellatus]
MSTSVEGYRLSPQQRRVWSVNPLTQVQTALRVEGPLNREVLEKALEKLVCRHEVLRTVFHEVPGLSWPVQVVLEQIEVAWTVVEDLHPEDVESALDRLFQPEFDLQTGPLVRPALLALTTGEELVVLNLSALIADSNSSHLMEKWFSLYEAMISDTVDTAEESEEEEITYSVISEWLNQLAEDEDSEAGRAYWARKRIDSVPSLQVPKRTVAQSAKPFLQKTVELSHDLWKSLENTARRWEIGAQDLVLTAWRAVWARVTGQSDMVMGWVCDGRTDEGVESALGALSRAVPLVVEFEGTELVSDAGRRLASAAKEAYEWQESWTGESVAESFSFQVGFESRARVRSYQAGAATFTKFRELAAVEKFDAWLSCQSDATGADLVFQVDPLLWSEAAIEQWAGAVLASLEQCVESVGTGSALTCADLAYWQETTRQAHADALESTSADEALLEDGIYLYNLENSEDQLSAVPLWRPRSGVQVRAVDASGEWVPLGAVGLLHVRRTGTEEWVPTEQSVRAWSDGRLELVKGDSTASSGAFTAPRSQVEQELAAIWQDVLRVEDIAVQDSFFDLGGHSLLATQVVMRMRAKYGVEFPMRIVFETKTLEALAQMVERSTGERGEGAVSGQELSIPRLGEQELYELSPSQKRLWFSSQLSQSSQYGTGFYYVIEDELHTESFARAFASVVERHEMLRTTIVVQDGVAYQRVTPGLTPSYREHDLSARPDAQQMEAVRARVLEVWTTPFDLSRESFFRVELFRLSERKSLLFLCAHHFGYDGWAVRLLIRDLNAFYTAYRHGKSHVDLPDVVSFFDVAAWLNKRLANGELQGQLEYWLSQLQDDVPPPEVPGDTGEFAANPLDVRKASVSPSVTAQLNDLAKRQGSSLYATVLSGVMAWLSQLSRQTTVTVGATLSGRTHPEMEEAFGPLINPVAMRTDLAGNPTFAEIVERTAKTSFDAYANQDYPFDLIWQELRKRGAKAPSLYSVILIGQNVTDGAVQLDGMSLQPRPLSELLSDRTDEVVRRLYGASEREHASYDLVLSMSEEGGGIVLEATYAGQKFRPETVDRYLAQMVRVLEQFAADPEGRLSQLQAEAVEEEDAWEELF